jgi:hypothetical protein
MKKFLIVLGFLSLILGIIGIVIPLLPTTPFLLLAAACFLKGSDRMYRWLMNHKLFGDYIRNFREHKAIPLRTKIFAISLLWITILFSIFFVVRLIYLRVLLAAIAIAVTAHILHFNTLKSEK